MMARLQVRIFLCLMLGLVTAVAVSWTVAIVRGHPGTTVTFDRDVRYYMPPSRDRLWIFTEARSAFVTERVAMCQLPQQGHRLVIPDERRRASTSSVPAWSVMRQTPARSAPPGPVTLAAEIGYGWPLPALWQTFDLGGANAVVDGGATLPAWLLPTGDPRSVPLLPSYASLVIDALALAVAWFIALFGFGTVRGIRRARLGLCRACGYDLKGTGPHRCPECGSVR